MYEQAQAERFMRANTINKCVAGKWLNMDKQPAKSAGECEYLQIHLNNRQVFMLSVATHQKVIESGHKLR